jgi:triacylglycerol lipase
MNNQTLIGSDLDTTTSRAIGDVIAMQLASITYCSTSGNLEQTFANYFPKWELAWLPTKSVEGNYAFIAFNGVQYVIAIRGSILNFSWSAFDDWFEDDFNILLQTKWNYTNQTNTNPMISQGAADGLANLHLLVNSNGETMLDFIMNNAIPNNNFLCVTGHSLGGNLATVYSLWLKYQIEEVFHKKSPSLFSVLTFAAPTSWNKDFATIFDNAFTNSWRYYNQLDIVPFSACNILGLKKLFPNPGTPADLALDLLFDTTNGSIEAAEYLYNSYYYEVNQQRGSIALNTNNTIYPVSSSDSIEAWFEQAGAQHDHNHYLDFLNGAEINCQS